MTNRTYETPTDADQALIALLRENARASTAELARRLGVSRTTVQSRIERLEARGIITGYGVRLSPAYEQELAEAKANANKIGQQANDAAKADAESTRKTLEAELEKKLADAEASIASIKAKAMKEVGTIAEDTTSAIVEALVGGKSDKTTLCLVALLAISSTGWRERLRPRLTSGSTALLSTAIAGLWIWISARAGR